MYEGHEMMIPGSGVNLTKWKYLEYPSDENGVEFLFVARIIKEKGIEEYLACADAIKKEYPDTSVILSRRNIECLSRSCCKWKTGNNN